MSRTKSFLTPAIMSISSSASWLSFIPFVRLGKAFQSGTHQVYRALYTVGRLTDEFLAGTLEAYRTRAVVTGLQAVRARIGDDGTRVREVS